MKSYMDLTELEKIQYNGYTAIGLSNESIAFI